MNYKEQLIDYVIKQNLLSGFVPTRELVEYQYDLLIKIPIYSYQASI